MLHPFINDVGTKVYCGPTAIAILTGFPVSKVYKMIRRLRSERERQRYGRVINGGRVKRIDGGKMPIGGMWNPETLKVLKRAGLRRTHRVEMQGKTTLGAFLEDRGHLGPCLINVTGHYMVACRGMLADTRHTTPIPWREYKSLSRRVVTAWYFSQPARQRQDQDHD